MRVLRLLKFCTISKLPPAISQLSLRDFLFSSTSLFKVREYREALGHVFRIATNLNPSKHHYKWFSGESHTRIKSLCRIPLSVEQKFAGGDHGETQRGTVRRRLVVMGFLGFLLGQEENPEETVENKILMTIKRAILAIQREEFPKAERLLKKAFQMSEVESLEDAKTQIIDIEANMYLQRGDLMKAENLFKQVAQRLVNAGRVPETDNSIVEISIKLSEIYKLLGRLEEAETGFQFCMESQREKINKGAESDEDTLLLAAWACHGLAQLRMARAGAEKSSVPLIEESMKLIKEAHSFAVRAAGPDAQQAVAILADLATAQALLGKFDEALATVESCAELSKDKHPDLLVTIQINAGNLMLQKGDFPTAEGMCKEAARFAETINEPNLKARAMECLRSAEEGIKKAAAT